MLVWHGGSKCNNLPEDNLYEYSFSEQLFNKYRIYLKHILLLKYYEGTVLENLRSNFILNDIDSFFFYNTFSEELFKLFKTPKFG